MGHEQLFLKNYFIIIPEYISLLLHKRVPIFGFHSLNGQVFLSIHLLNQNSLLQRIPAGDRNSMVSTKDLLL